MNTNINLCEYETGNIIRTATVDEYKLSVAASKIDGGAGVITIDGVRCYVEGEPEHQAQIVTDTEIVSTQDLWDAISGKSPIATGKGEKLGSRTELDLHEYDLGNERFLQVAFDPDLGGAPVEWEETRGSLSQWIVG